MVAEIVSTLTSWVVAMTDLIINLFLSFTELFWNSSESEITLLGVLALMSTAVGLIYLGLRFVIQLFPGAHQL